MRLLVTGDRRSRLEVGYDLGPDSPDGFAGSILARYAAVAAPKAIWRPRLWPLRQTIARPSRKPRMYRSTPSCPRVCGLQLVIRFRVLPLIVGLFFMVWLLRAGGRRGGERRRWRWFLDRLAAR